MANHRVDVSERRTPMARLRRELRNPSMLTVGLIIFSALFIPLVLLVPSWVSTTQGSLQDRREAREAIEERLLSSSVLIPSQIAPWVLNQVTQMETAKSPADWRLTSFTAGPCDQTNLSQLPSGPYASAIADSCSSLLQIQTDHADECQSIQLCNISIRAQGRLNGVRVNLLAVFSEAGFVLPYVRDEEQTDQ